jgi:hypothetical protein
MLGLLSARPRAEFNNLELHKTAVNKSTYNKKQNVRRAKPILRSPNFRIGLVTYICIRTCVPIRMLRCVRGVSDLGSSKRFDMINLLDELDEALQQRVFDMPGACIGEIIRPFLSEKSESVLRQRVRALELRRLIRSQKTKKEVLLFPIVEG